MSHNPAIVLFMNQSPKDWGTTQFAVGRSLTTHSELCVRDNIFSVCKSSRFYQWVTGRQLFSGLINYFLTCQVVLPSLLTMQTSCVPSELLLDVPFVKSQVSPNWENMPLELELLPLCCVPESVFLATS